ncbi:hypothetical protein BDW66DRAFT_142788 [Aspergillus desertorum]
MGIHKIRRHSTIRAPYSPEFWAALSGILISLCSGAVLALAATDTTLNENSIFVNNPDYLQSAPMIEELIIDDALTGAAEEPQFGRTHLNCGEV